MPHGSELYKKKKTLEFDFCRAHWLFNLFCIKFRKKNGFKKKKLDISVHNVDFSEDAGFILSVGGIRM